MKHSKKGEQVIHIAIVGRPNVGKSTLFNRLIGKRKSVTDLFGGTTRDRVYERVGFNDKEVYIIDTGGIKFQNDESLDSLVDKEVNKALVEADLVLFVCDVSGLTALDYQLVDDLRRRNKKVVLVVNKVDEGHDDYVKNDYYELGFSELVEVSALHGNNMAKLIEVIYSCLPLKCSIPDISCEFNLGIIGEPNAGKSTLLNCFLEYERAVVSDIAGTTRDVIEEIVEYNGSLIQLVDTAGIKKKKKMKSTAALFSLFRAQKSIKKSDIVFLLVDAKKGPQKDTRMIYKTVHDLYKGCIVLINKWDLVSNLPMEDYRKRLIKECGFLNNIPILFISALTGRNADSAMQEACVVWRSYAISIPTGELNDFLTMIKQRKTPPPTVKFKYMVQVDTKPPTFVLFVKNQRRIEQHYLNFIVNNFIRHFNLKGVMPKIYLKEEKK